MNIRFEKMGWEVSVDVGESPIFADIVMTFSYRNLSVSVHDWVRKEEINGIVDDELKRVVDRYESFPDLTGFGHDPKLSYEFRSEPRMDIPGYVLSGSITWDSSEASYPQRKVFVEVMSDTWIEPDALLSFASFIYVAGTDSE